MAMAAMVGVLSYASQHLWARGAPMDFGVPTVDAHIPFYGRVGVVALQALLVGSLVYLGATEDQSRVWLDRVPTLVLCLLPVAALMVLFP